MITTKAVPAVAYLRRSTDKQEQSLSDQRREVRRYAEEQGYEVVREYVDDAISGTSAEERPGFQRMIADARTGEFQAVIVWNSDRFSRGDVTETEHYRYLLRQADVKVLSVTEDYLARDGIDGDVLRTVKQFQNRQYSISLSQNTLRGQISAVMAESDPGRAAPYGYDREILAPDGSVMFRIRFCPGRVREVYDRGGRLQARYEKGQSLSKPGKECKARLVLGAPERVQVIRDIFEMCLGGKGFTSIAAALNARGLPAPVRDHWGSTTVKAILENPTYRGDLVWNRRTEAKFYRIENGRAQKRRRQSGEAKVVRTPKDEWLVVPDAVPAVVSREDWDKAQVKVAKRRGARGGAGHLNRRWLLTGVLECGDCGHKFWGDPRCKGRRPGRAPVVTSYYTCSGRRSHGKTICPASSTLRAEHLEEWVLGKLGTIVATDEDAIEAATRRFVESVVAEHAPATDAERIAREIGQVEDLVTALTMNIDPANLSMLNDRLTQLRLRKEALEEELRVAKRAATDHDIGALRKWARTQLTNLQAAMDGVRNDETREVIGAYVDRIVVWPSEKRGEMVLNPGARSLWKEHDRPNGRSWCNLVGATGFEPATSWSRTKRSSQTELRPDGWTRDYNGGPPEINSILPLPERPPAGILLAVPCGRRALARARGAGEHRLPACARRPIVSKSRVASWILVALAIWAAMVCEAAAAFLILKQPDPDQRAVILMGGCLFVVWCAIGGGVQWLLRDRLAGWARRIPIGWRTRFVLLCILMALLEEAVTTSLTNLAPWFGGVTDAARITASKNYLEVVCLNSVIVFIPAYIAWVVILSFFDFSPAEVMLLYGLTGWLGETMTFGPGHIGMVGMWTFVYGLMVWLPAWTVPQDRKVRPVRWWMWPLAAVVPLVAQMPLALVVLAVRRLIGYEG